MSMPTALEPVQLLWTGGWDSSFRLLQLLLIEKRAVQPIYVISLGRRTALLEFQAMERMRQALLPRLRDPAQLLPTKVAIQDQYPARQELADLWESINSRARLGAQYLWLASVAEALDWRGVELSLEAYPGGMAEFEHLVFDAPGRLNDSPEAALFSRFTFPVMHLTKREMGDIAREHGFYDILMQRWFCQDPVGGKACGHCRPCRLANRDGVDFAGPVAVLATRVWRRVQWGAWVLRQRVRGAQVGVVG